MENWDVVDGVSHPYVAKHPYVVSGQVKEKEGGMAVWDRPGRGKTQRYYGPPIHGLEWTNI